MLTNGNLVLYRPNGQVRWQTGTAGTGNANRLVMQQNGNLVLSTNAGALVWSSRTPARSATPTAWSATPTWPAPGSGSAVYVNGLVHQKSSAGQLIASAGRTVYLQRYLNGRWQNVLARTTASHGQLSVGFIQSTVYQYRLLVLPAASDRPGRPAARPSDRPAEPSGTLHIRAVSRLLIAPPELYTEHTPVLSL